MLKTANLAFSIVQQTLLFGKWDGPQRSATSCLSHEYVTLSIAYIGSMRSMRSIIEGIIFRNQGPSLIDAGHV